MIPPDGTTHGISLGTDQKWWCDVHGPECDLLRYYAELCEDRERLDWVEENRGEIANGDLDPSGEDASLNGWWCFDGDGIPAPNNGLVYPTARAAIDAARGKIL